MKLKIRPDTISTKLIYPELPAKLNQGGCAATGSRSCVVWIGSPSHDQVLEDLWSEGGKGCLRKSQHGEDEHARGRCSGEY